MEYIKKLKKKYGKQKLLSSLKELNPHLNRTQKKINKKYIRLTKFGADDQSPGGQTSGVKRSSVGPSTPGQNPARTDEIGSSVPQTEERQSQRRKFSSAAANLNSPPTQEPPKPPSQESPQTQESPGILRATQSQIEGVDLVLDEVVPEQNKGEKLFLHCFKQLGKLLSNFPDKPIYPMSTVLVWAMTNIKDFDKHLTYRYKNNCNGKKNFKEYFAVSSFGSTSNSEENDLLKILYEHAASDVEKEKIETEYNKLNKNKGYIKTYQKSFERLVKTDGKLAIHVLLIGNFKNKIRKQILTTFGVENPVIDLNDNVVKAIFDCFDRGKDISDNNILEKIKSWQNILKNDLRFHLSNDEKLGWKNTFKQNNLDWKTDYDKIIDNEGIDSEAITNFETEKSKCRCALCGSYMVSEKKSPFCTHMVELEHQISKGHSVLFYLRVLWIKKKMDEVWWNDYVSQNNIKQVQENEMRFFLSIGGSLAINSTIFTYCCTLCNQIKSDMLPYKLGNYNEHNVNEFWASKIDEDSIEAFESALKRSFVNAFRKPKESFDEISNKGKGIVDKTDCGFIWALQFISTFLLKKELPVVLRTGHIIKIKDEVQNELENVMGVMVHNPESWRDNPFLLSNNSVVLWRNNPFLLHGEWDSSKSAIDHDLTNPDLDVFYDKVLNLTEDSYKFFGSPDGETSFKTFETFKTLENKFEYIMKFMHERIDTETEEQQEQEQQEQQNIYK